MVVAIGAKYTKDIDKIVATEKEYIAEVKLGETSTTDDEEGIKKQLTFDHKPLTNEIEEVIKGFIGRIEQIPPAFSAIKIAGKRAYDLARSGENPEMKPRKVEIKNIGILDYSYPLLRLKVTTAKGVYIRSLARDIGAKLGTGAYLAWLERTRVGKYTKEKSLTLEQFAEQNKNRLKT